MCAVDPDFTEASQPRDCRECPDPDYCGCPNHLEKL